MHYNIHFHSWAHGIRHVVAHVVITLLAIAMAFYLPEAAKYILYHWWPMVEYDSHLLVITEIGFAVVLVILFNIALIAVDARRSLRMNRIASLVYGREKNSWFSRRGEHELRKKFLCARDFSILSITGYDTFSLENCMLQQPLQQSYEIRVMLMNPNSEGAVKRVSSLSNPEVLLETYRAETETSIAYLKKLSAAGKKITLKFYDDPPFWKLVVTGEYVWVQYCHDGYEIKNQPEYVFALQRDYPNRGFFAPFYMYFLNQWNDPRHPEYNLETDKLIYRNAEGNEIMQLAFKASVEDGLAGESGLAAADESSAYNINDIPINRVLPARNGSAAVPRYHRAAR